MLIDVSYRLVYKEGVYFEKVCEYTDDIVAGG